MLLGILYSNDPTLGCKVIFSVIFFGFVLFEILLPSQQALWSCRDGQIIYIASLFSGACLTALVIVIPWVVPLYVEIIHKL